MQDISLTEVLNQAFDFNATSMYTALPCVVVGVHSSLSSAMVDVQPCINDLYADKKSVEHPPILSVPVIFPASKTSALTFPVNVGDTVLCVFSQRGMDNFKLGDGSPNAPTDFRKFDKRDAVAIPGLFPFSKSPNDSGNRSLPHSTTDMVMAHNLGGAEVEVRLKANGDVLIKSPTTVTVDCKDAVVNSDTATLTVPNTTWTGDMTFNGNITQNGIFVLDGINMNTHVHGGVATGPSKTSVPE